MNLIMTARQRHSLVMDGYRYWRDDSQRIWRPKIRPTKEQAMDYVECVRTLRRYYSNSYPNGAERLSPHQTLEMEQKQEYYESLHLDMRDVVIRKNGKSELQRVTGVLLVPPLYQHIAETYDCISTLTRADGSVWCVPVREGDKYALCEMDGKGTLLTGFIYDSIYRHFGGYVSMFVVEQNGKKGLVSQFDGEPIIPCEMDEIYEMKDADGVIPFKQGRKWGMAYGTVCSEPVFEELDIRSECYVRGRIGNEWYWVDGEGMPTRDKKRRFFGSWSDLDK